VGLCFVGSPTPPRTGTDRQTAVPVRSAALGTATGSGEWFWLQVAVPVMGETWDETLQC
jgi:hypothetical protein